MSYEAIFLNSFLRQNRKLSVEARRRIVRTVEELVNNPYLGARLRGELTGFWKVRVGKYRMLYKIDGEKKRIIFYDIDLRKRIYR